MIIFCRHETAKKERKSEYGGRLIRERPRKQHGVGVGLYPHWRLFTPGVYMEMKRRRWSRKKTTWLYKPFFPFSVFLRFEMCEPRKSSVGPKTEHKLLPSAQTSLASSQALCSCWPVCPTDLYGQRWAPSEGVSSVLPLRQRPPLPSPD